ncbi:MAG: homocysteine S-methyltransferase family protein [Clostridia bacterium]|nr:homocysteine S-methyltransferase family protein [Clostridia bacterium]
MTVIEYLADNLLFMDGGTGTLLQAAGMPAGVSSEQFGLDRPDVVTAIHKRYYDAGCNVVSTNTFGVNGLKYADGDIQKMVENALACVAAARDQSEAKQKKFIALDLGPLGKLLKPYGELDFEDAVAAFAKTVNAGKDKADLVFIETMNDTYETKAALLAAKENCDLPVFVSNAYSEDGRLMSGADPAVMVAMLEGLGADAIGVNCSFGPKALAPIVEQYLARASVPVLLKPNAGLPRVENGKTVFDVTPDEFAADVTALIKKGVRVAGGCCGTTPEHLAALIAACDGQKPVPTTKKHTAVVCSGCKAVNLDGFTVIGERLNPTGKKRFRQALAERDMTYILGVAAAQQEQGADVLDVNVGTPEIDEPTLLPDVVAEVQAVSDLPLQIDTSDPVAMERALRRYIGKPMINSVNGKEDSMKSVFPLAKKYGGVVVALTLDEAGIPTTADGRVAIAKRILKTAETYGIDKDQLIFDPLTMTVSADKNAALVTLEAVRRITEELGCKTSLGVSNVSFGLPHRELLNGEFLALAKENGLSAAILNPAAPNIEPNGYARAVLLAEDENCEAYITYAASLEDTPTPVLSVGDETLADAICKGMKDAAVAKTKALLADTAPLAIVENEMIPALDRVGQGYEQGVVFLPQLLRAAECAAAGFEEIKAAMSDSDTVARNGKIVLATVKGDIHDIGKNIVKLLLENYGFTVIDLGRDVPPEAIVSAALEQNAGLVGLSALMTTTVPAMEDTIRALRERAPQVKVVVGGAVLTPDYAAQIGADFYGKDAMDTVRIAETLFA